MSFTEPTARKALPADLHWTCRVTDDPQLKRLQWRAHHRGTREADLLVGGFFDAHACRWSEDERAKFAELLEEQDVDIIAWATGTSPPPDRFEGPMIEALQRLDYIRISR